jgi:hypothetical protein
LEKNEPFPTLKGMICRKYSFHKLPQLSLANNELVAAAFNIDGFLWTDTCFFNLTTEAHLKQTEPISA